MRYLKGNKQWRKYHYCFSNLECINEDIIDKSRAKVQTKKQGVADLFTNKRATD